MFSEQLAYLGIGSQNSKETPLPLIILRTGILGIGDVAAHAWQMMWVLMIHISLSLSQSLCVSLFNV